MWKHTNKLVNGGLRGESIATPYFCWYNWLSKTNADSFTDISNSNLNCLLVRPYPLWMAVTIPSCLAACLPFKLMSVLQRTSKLVLTWKDSETLHCMQKEKLVCSKQLLQHWYNFYYTNSDPPVASCWMTCSSRLGSSLLMAATPATPSGSSNDT